MTTYDTILASIRSILDLPELSLEKPRETGHGDYATNAALQMAKSFGKNPHDMATGMLPKITALPFVESGEIAGPGFINIKIKNDFILSEINKVNLHPKADKPLVIDIDYGSYNVGKELHIGHLRTSIVGDSLVRIGRFLGHKIIGYNHMGDWGRNMAIVVAGIINRYPDVWKNPDFDIPLHEINEYYVEASTRAKEDPEFMKLIHTIKVELQNHHHEYFPLYEKFLAVSLDMMHSAMRKLNMLQIDNDKGERNAHQYIPDAEKWLREKGLLELSDGAEVIHVKRNDDTAPMPPYMFRDSRGATTYDSADIAAAYYRKITDNPDIGLYIVGTEQILHFEQLFRVLDKMGMFPYGTRIHMPIGMMTGKDGKIFKTRNGGNATLIDMIDMVDIAVRERVKNTNKELDIDTMHMIALSALKFNDFIHDLRSMYTFDPDEITAFEGRTGPYILYTAVRLNSALKKSEPSEGNVGHSNECGNRAADDVRNATDSTSTLGAITTIENDFERDLLLKILDFPKMIVTTFEKRALDILANYTYDLASLANVFYHHCPIKGNINRIGIASLASHTLTQCIELMGLAVPSEM